jgi:hypothetical protein
VQELSSERPDDAERPRPRFINADSGYRADPMSMLNDALETALRYSKAESRCTIRFHAA